LAWKKSLNLVYDKNNTGHYLLGGFYQRGSFRQLKKIKLHYIEQRNFVKKESTKKLLIFILL